MNDATPAGKTIQRLIDSAASDAQKWLSLGDEIDKYTTSDDYAFIYQEFDADLSFRARVNKVSEFKQIIGPYLYPQNPDAEVNSADWSPYWAQERHKVEERYADYSARHGDLAVEMRRAIDHGLTYGRAPIWCGYNQRKGVVQHVSDTVHHLVVDPDARTVQEQNFQGRIRIKPRWELAKRYPDSADVIARLPSYTKPNSDKKRQSSDNTCDLVKYHEVWMGVGVENYMPSAEAVEGDTNALSAKKKYCIADGKILHESDWEIPFFLIDEWPGTYLDFLERPGSIYPTQPMEPGMGHLRAMNYFYTLFIAKYRLMSRTPFASVKINGQGIESDQLFKILRGEQLDILTIAVNGSDVENVDINKYFQRIDWGDPVPGFERAWGLFGREFEKATGLYELLYTGTTPTQIRTATAADLIESKSKSRIDAFRETTVKTMEKLFRKTLFAARYLESGEDIAKKFGPKAGATWGEMANPDMVAQEAALREQLMGDAAASGMPTDGLEEQMGPPQFVAMEAWLTEADRTIDAGSMTRLDHEAKITSLNVALNQLGPAVANMPGGGKFVSALAQEFASINRLSPELQAAAKGIAEAIDQAQMQQMPITQSGPTPGGLPGSGPDGGDAMISPQ